MRIALFCHSLISDWNHGNAHFLRGVASELLSRGHELRVYEPQDGWSLRNLTAEQGQGAIDSFHAAFPHLHTTRYDLHALDLDQELEDAALVIVHEWNDHDLVRRIGEVKRRNSGFLLLFHDTHHRAVTAPEQMAAYDLSNYDGVLAFGEAIREIYVRRGLAARAWTWHEAADVRVFRPLAGIARERDLVWIGNWGDGERTAELREFLLEPVRDLGLQALIHGVRYPQHALDELTLHGVGFGGWIANYAAPRAFAAARVTVHVPRRPYVEALPGIPTIRPFEALACGIPLVSAPWDDTEKLFARDRDYLTARNGRDMRECFRAILNEPALAEALARHGRQTILERHTCRHRVDELLAICAGLRGIKDGEPAAAAART